MPQAAPIIAAGAVAFGTTAAKFSLVAGLLTGLGPRILETAVDGKVTK